MSCLLVCPPDLSRLQVFQQVPQQIRIPWQRLVDCLGNLFVISMGGTVPVFHHGHPSGITLDESQAECRPEAIPRGYTLHSLSQGIALHRLPGHLKSELEALDTRITNNRIFRFSQRFLQSAQRLLEEDHSSEVGLRHQAPSSSRIRAVASLRKFIAALAKSTISMVKSVGSASHASRICSII